ncbi:hypothetical protein C8F04DRAFT_1195333 [Mycena alexandri]|uniref:Uncharacterized protein n=1 Tax=Mycena alexandri TaxID=1745969 RepID=A0AAD6S662_9AGAR|nr:hypothetical protein C8F04DRAFT_1195333 [Mycena alexandri]
MSICVRIGILNNLKRGSKAKEKRGSIHSHADAGRRVRACFNLRRLPTPLPSAVVHPYDVRVPFSASGPRVQRCTVFDVRVPLSAFGSRQPWTARFRLDSHGHGYGSHHESGRGSQSPGLPHLFEDALDIVQRCTAYDVLFVNDFLQLGKLISILCRRVNKKCLKEIACARGESNPEAAPVVVAPGNYWQQMQPCAAQDVRLAFYACDSQRKSRRGLTACGRGESNPNQLLQTFAAAQNRTDRSHVPCTTSALSSACNRLTWGIDPNQLLQFSDSTIEGSGAPCTAPAFKLLV